MSEQFSARPSALVPNEGSEAPPSSSTVELPRERGSRERELKLALYDLLSSAEQGQQPLDSEIRELEREFQGAVYSELIYLMSHLRFDADEAKAHWTKIVEHRRFMERRLESRVDLRIALVSYFLEVNRKLDNPKVIEMKLFEQTQASAYRDELTGLYNYRFFEECLGHELAKADRYLQPLSLLMIDVDDFKDYNDNNGHETANQVLAMVAELLGQSLRRTDIAARYGGEEFVVIMPWTPKADARTVAERVREQVELYRFYNEEAQPHGNVTVSIGVATFPGDARESSELVRRADRAMYLAKSKGKNQVELYGQSLRSFERVTARIPGSFRVLAPKDHPLTTSVIGEGGLLFRSSHKVVLGSFIDLNLELPGVGRPVQASGVVLRVNPLDDGKYELAVELTDIAARDRSLLSRYIRGKSRTQ